MSEGPRLLSDYPWVVVNFDCKLCPRTGRYRLVRLGAKYGPEIALERLLEMIAADCEWMRPGVKPRKYEGRCGIRFSDLDRRGPPPDLPPSSGARPRLVWSTTEKARPERHEPLPVAASRSQSVDPVRPKDR